MRRLYIIILCLCCCLTSLQAQNNETLFRDIYDQAEEDYNVGRLEQAEQQLKSHIKEFPVTLQLSAYRLLSLCYIGMDREEDAVSYVRLMLAENPYYSPTISDPQRFIDMVEDIKSGLSATITTASSQAETLQEVPVPTTLITEDMIRDSGARNLQELLAAYVPGMYIIDCNDDINIAMRGIYSTGQEKILFMLNGHRLNSYCTNTAAPDFSISLEKLKQVEVLRGPASSLYGGVSLTAVVNLITKQGSDVDGLKGKVGIGNYGQWKGDLLFGKRYFDVDLLVWGGFHAAKGQTVTVDKEDTGLRMFGGDVTVGGVGNRPSYDFGASVKYKNLRFLYNTQFSQIQAPMTMTHTYSPYDITKYKTFNANRPSRTTISHHADLSYGQMFGDVFLKGQIAFDNSDLSYYQVISDQPLPGFLDVLPLPTDSKSAIKNPDSIGGLARYISGQEHTLSFKVQGDWSYINKGAHKGLLTFGVEYNYFQLDDARYVFAYNFTKSLPETVNISEVGKGHENNANGFLQLKHQWGPVILNAGLRYDYKQRYDSTHIREFSPRVALIFVQPKWNVKLSYSKAFIDAPYLYRKTNQMLLAFMGAKGSAQLAMPLTPESMHSYQLTFGATQLVKGLNVELNGFYNRTRDLIYMDFIEHYNMGNSDIFGLELSANYESKRFSAHLSTTWQKDSKYELYDEDDIPRAYNMPRFMTSAVLAWQATKHLRLHTHAAYCSSQRTRYYNVVNRAICERAANQFNQLVELEMIRDLTPEEQASYDQLLQICMETAQHFYAERDVSPYFIMDLGANYTIDRFEFSFNVHNLLNRRYSLSGACTGLIPQQGRWFMGTVAVKL